MGVHYIERHQQRDTVKKHIHSFFLSVNSTAMDFNLENPFPSDPNPISSLFLHESAHMPSLHYTKTLKSNNSAFFTRKYAIDLISKFSSSFDPFLSYLSVNFLDRFLSSQTMPHSKPWVLRLIAISCLSLAAKMQKTEFSFEDFKVDGGLIFDSQTINRMEIIILGALKWRMRSITPFSFIPFFITLFQFQDPPLLQDLKARATEIIFKSQNEVKLLEFNPSVIAASALLSASHELFPLQCSRFGTSISSSSTSLDQENLTKCYKLMLEMVKNSYEADLEINSSSDTPVNVLELQLSSSESERTPLKSSKRRKTSNYCCKDEKDEQLYQW